MFSYLRLPFKNLGYTPASNHWSRLTSKITASGVGRFVVPLAWASGSLYLMANNKLNCSTLEQQVQTFQTRRDNMKV